MLTLNMDVPEPWLVEPVEAAADLDNLRLADLPQGGLHAGFELEALILSGQCMATVPGRRGQVRMGILAAEQISCCELCSQPVQFTAGKVLQRGIGAGQSAVPYTKQVAMTCG